VPPPEHALSRSPSNSSKLSGERDFRVRGTTVLQVWWLCSAHATAGLYNLWDMRGSLLSMLVALVMALVACSPAAQPAPPTPVPTQGTAKKIGIAYSNIIADSLSLWVARESGIFARNGLDVDLQYIASSNAFAALLAGQVQASSGGGSEVISGAANGADVVVIVNLMPIYPYFMEAPASIQKPEDFKGKSIAITNPGATFDIASRVALKKAGLNPDADVQWVKTGSVANVQAALQSGQVQGGLAQVPDTLKLEAAGLHPVIDMSTLNAPASGTVVTMQRTYIADNKDVPQKIVDSILQAYTLEKQDKATTVKILKQYLKSEDDAAMGATYDYFVAKAPPVAPKPENFMDSFGVLAEQNPKIRDVDLTKILDASYFQNAVDRKLGG
jgi:NitT/TauT family transport system substrate-binding protein